MGWGDEVVAAGQAQRLWDEDPSTRIAICGLDGQVRWHALWVGNPIIASPGMVLAGETVRRIVSGPNCRPYITYPFSEETGWTFNKDFRCRDHVARIYLTPDEMQLGEETRAQIGQYVLIEPFTKHENFEWPIERWNELVASSPDLTFLQHAHPQTKAFVSGAHVINASFRQACALAKYSLAYVRSESGMCHAAAALGVRQVTLFGGCMDPEVMGGYKWQTVIADRGKGSPCGSWRRCEHCIAAMARISVEKVRVAMRGAVASRKAA